MTVGELIEKLMEFDLDDTICLAILQQETGYTEYAPIVLTLKTKYGDMPMLCADIDKSAVMYEYGQDCTESCQDC